MPNGVRLLIMGSIDIPKMLNTLGLGLGLGLYIIDTRTPFHRMQLGLVNLHQLE